MANIASMYHFQSDGSFLRPPRAISTSAAAPSRAAADGTSAFSVLSFWPPAARADLHSAQHHHLAYANSKLAQVLHAKEVQRHIAVKTEQASAMGTSPPSPRGVVRAVSVCPGFVKTGIIPDNLLGWIVQLFAFPTEIGAHAPLYALLSHSLNRGEFVTASRLPGLPLDVSFADLCSFLGRGFVRGVGVDMLFFVMILVQGVRFGVGVSESSYESLDLSLSTLLFGWSLKVTAEFR